MRQLAFIGSTLTVVLFLVCYMTFKLLWSYDRDLQDSIHRQQFETERVKTVLAMEELELRASVEDYAAWNNMADYVQSPSPVFIDESIGIHAFISKIIDGIIIFDRDANPVWSGFFNGSEVVEQSFIALENQATVDKLLFNARQSDPATIASYVDYATYQNSAFMIASSRICTSNAVDCNYGFLVFIRKIRPQFVAQLELATGVDITVSVSGDSEHPRSQPADNTSFLYKEDNLTARLVEIKVMHNEKLPAFISWQEMTALAFFALVMFGVNMYIVNFFIAPLSDAERYLKQFGRHGDKLPSEDSFVSKEMRSFARQINSIITELEHNRALLKQQSSIDTLTGIANRRCLYQQAKQFFDDLEYRYAAVILVDVDHFKLYNDNYGHILGDDTLKQVAEALQAVDSDYEKIVGRYGGEEFCIILAADKPIPLKPYLSKLITAVREMNIAHHYSPTSEHVTVSAGATLAQIDAYSEISRLIQQADDALYLAKANGRNRAEIYSKPEVKAV
ncbi:sensor domain-containing diguanylate cyclase [Vibrio sp. JPW-9-11-11]|uniref:sensor domain-containing diguanylate cyclase n=1 Tax=Vibrio sp. JPW-9-11-11 TaxID=1416532 RepID=UPI0020CF1B39|nr:diguanylate cyclase [Vibrio sp. JPW-9-11-11]